MFTWAALILSAIFAWRIWTTLREGTQRRATNRAELARIARRLRSRTGEDDSPGRSSGAVVDSLAVERRRRRAASTRA